MKPQALLACGTVALAQQVYIPAQGPALRPKCSGNCTYSTAIPQYTFREFSFTQTETVRTATSLPAPTAMTTYAPPYASLSSLVPNLTTTQWGNWYPNGTVATDTANPYGNASWTALWSTIPWVNFTRGIYSTTVSPTPVPTSELVLPPPEYSVPETCYYFPADFMLGVAAAAVQIEGAIADEGRAPVHNDVAGLASAAQNVGGLVTADSSPDYIAIENYYLFKQDIERLAAMGVKYYRFSIPWTRILPFILPGTPVNEQALSHYDELINFVLEKGMQPALMLYHNDAPFQFYGGNLTNLFIAPGTGGIGYLDSCFQCSYKNVSFEDAFVNYGKIVMTHFADRIPIWWSFNEPILASRNGRSINAVIKAHARLSHFYHDEIKGTGRISLTLNDNFGVPRNPQDPADVDAADHFNSFQLATFANPIFLGIDYPESFKSSISDYVPLTAEDLAYINGTADFFSIQPYTATVVSPPNDTIAACSANISHPLRPYCVTQQTITTTGWNIGYRSQSYVYITPTYFRTYLNYLWNTWKTPVAVTEFGFPVFAEQEKSQRDQEFDSPRSQYYQSYLNEGLKAIWEDGVKFVGAFAWTWADNWEFGDYSQKFGIQTVNRTTMERRYKKSFFDYVDFVESRRQTS
jgi:beta-glucosidase/6-phospho-beta-glucosidase/beta-galactosidase